MINSEDNYSSGFDFCKRYLTGDEYVLWQGRPEKGMVFSFSDVITTLFSVVWLAFSVFWEYTVIKNSPSVVMVLWGIPFVAVGIYLLFGRFIQRIIADKNTYYVVTNKRIIIKQGRRIKFFDGDDLPPMNITIHKNGNGTISFSEVFYSGRYRSVRYIALKNLADVTQAQEAINAMSSGDSERYYNDSSAYYAEEQSPLNNPDNGSKASPLAKIIPIIIFVVMVIGMIAVILNSTGVFKNRSEVQTQNSSVSAETDFRDVISILKDRGYETDNIAPTYGYQDEIHLSNVAAGVKDNSRFEFYEYSEDGSPDGVYDTITFGYSQNMSQEELANHETNLQENGKKFSFVQDGTLIVVAYKNNTVIYAESPENSTEIQDIMAEIGYV